MKDYFSALPDNIYSHDDIRNIERDAVEYGIEGFTLMNRAGFAAYKFISENFFKDKNIKIVAGSGNNAGDGFVIAELLAKDGYQVTCYELFPEEKYSPLAKKTKKLAQDCGVKFTKDISFADDDIVIDAIFGIGLDRDIVGDIANIIEQINNLELPIIAIDIPSGLNSKSGQARGVAIKATYTVTFLGLKTGLFCGDAKDYVGEIIFNDLEIDDIIYEKFTPEYKLLKKKTINLPSRKSDSNKGSFGHLLIIAGNKNMGGAAILAGEAALRSGCGKVTIATHPNNVNAIIERRPELMTRAIEDAKQIDEIINKVDAVVIGPGLGQDDWASSLLNRVIFLDIAKVIDADALNLIAASDLNKLNNAILTPHPGEAARLLKTDSSNIQFARKDSIIKLAEKYDADILLKGSGSLVCSKNAKEIYICPYGNSGMATAGTGDVLSGIIGSFIASGLNNFNSLKSAVTIHAYAGDLAKEDQGERSIVASDLIKQFHKII